MKVSGAQRTQWPDFRMLAQKCGEKHTLLRLVDRSQGKGRFAPCRSIRKFRPCQGTSQYSTSRLQLCSFVECSVPLNACSNGTGPKEYCASMDKGIL